MSTTRTSRRAGLAAALLTIGPAAAVTAAGDENGRDDPYLLGRAVLPVETYAPGPPAGGFFGNVVTNGVEFPLPSQPVEGFSGIVAGRRPGEYLAMPDNGFGTEANSKDFLIRAYYLTPDFETARGGTGAVVVGEFIQFSDPDGKYPYPLERADRLLTGGDIDPESIQRDHRGDLWLGDEFGPWILHFDATGRLLEAPIHLPDGLVSPSHPALGGSSTVNGSRGLEAMAISPDGRDLVVVLEGAVPGDAAASRRIYRYDTTADDAADAWTRLPDYRVTAPVGSEGARFVADAQMLDAHRLLVIERDNGSGATANVRWVYEIDLNRTGEDGAVVKREVVNLAAIPDPDLISLPAVPTADIGLGDPFRVTCESIEALFVVSHAELLLGCDNNFPNRGRHPTRADDTELILVKAPGL